jgi:hypothetical protein
MPKRNEHNEQRKRKYIVIRVKGTDMFIAEGGNAASGWWIEEIPPYLCEGVAWATSTDETDAYDLIRDLCASSTDVKPDQFELVEVRVVVAPRYAITAIKPKWFLELVKGVSEELRRTQTDI